MRHCCAIRFRYRFLHFGKQLLRMGTIEFNSKPATCSFAYIEFFKIMKKIVIATDFSAEAKNAMLYAATAAAEKGYEMVIFTLQNIPIHAQNARLSSDSINEFLHKKEKELNDVAATVSSGFGIAAVPYFATGEFYEEIARCIEMHHADLVVVGMAQKSFEQDLLGNTTTKAFSRLTIPVLAIPLSASYKGIKNILFACDMTRGVHKQVLDNVKSFSRDFGAKVEVFHVRHIVEELYKESLRNENLHQVQEELNGISYLYKNVQSDEIVEAIKKEIELIKADLLIMIPYRYGFWGSLVHRSKTRMMASGNSIPLLSIPL